MKLTILADGSVMTSVENDRGYLDCAQYVRHRNIVFLVTERGSLLPAFGGLRMHRNEPLALAVRRGLAGERGKPRINWSTVARWIIAAAFVAGLYITFPR